MLTRAMKCFVVFLVVFCAARTVHGDCLKPTGRENMHLESLVTFPVPEGTSVTFACDVGYSAVGTRSITCSNGQWSALMLNCEIKTCGSAGEVTNGYVDYSEGTDFGATARVICNEGYRPTGEPTVYCGAQGWLGRLALCEVVVCDPPNPISNGAFDPVKDHYEYSEVVRYSCTGDFKLNGSRTSVCTDKGTFDSATPNCVRVECPNPMIESGIVASGSRPPYTLMTSVTFRCYVGYDMSGPSTVSCAIDSKWTPPFPNCNPIQCKSPEIVNAEVVGGSRGTYNFSQTVTLQCSEGYNLKGNAVLKCGEKSLWSLPLPECTLIQCSTPEVTDGELVDGLRPSYKYKDTVTFKCLSGTMTGESTLTCGQNGQWAPILPKCTPVECVTPEIKHGWLLVGLRPSYKNPDSVSFQCESGYTLTGSSTVTCDLNSQWTPELPQCTRSSATTITVTVSVLIIICIAGVILFIIYKKKKRAIQRRQKKQKM